MNHNSLARADVFFEQSRYDLAEKEVRKYLERHVEDGMAYAYLAYARTRQNKKNGTHDLALKGLQYCPDNPFPMYALSLSYLLNKGDANKSEELAIKALGYQPDNAWTYHLLSLIKRVQGEWQSSLEFAEKGLGIDPENIDCKNSKARALLHFKRGDEAKNILNESLEKDPNNYMTLTNKGYQALDEGNTDEALEFFHESLRVDPTKIQAKKGLVLALKGKHWFFKHVIKFYQWAADLDKRHLGFPVVGLFITPAILKRLTNYSPQAAPYFALAISFYGIFIISILFSSSFFDILLRFNEYGRQTLLKPVIWNSTSTTILAALTIIQLTLYILTPYTQFLWGAIGTFLLIVTYSSMFALLGWSNAFLPVSIATVLLTALLPVSLIVSAFGYSTPAVLMYITSIVGIISLKIVSVSILRKT